MQFSQLFVNSEPLPASYIAARVTCGPLRSMLPRMRAIPAEGLHFSGSSFLARSWSHLADFTALGLLEPIVLRGQRLVTIASIP